MSSKASWRRSASVSPGSGGSTSVNIGTITSGQPWRISDSVPSKSNRTWLMPGRGAKLGRRMTSPVKSGLITSPLLP